jgi:GR25 family glycosyltransferase involved in LPS biosynthesis
VLQGSYEKGLDKVLIFEDDAIVTSSFSRTLLKEYLSQLKNLLNWDLVGFGGISSCWSSAPKQVSKYFYQTPFFELHAYVASRKFMKTVIETSYDGQVDFSFARRAYSTSYLSNIEFFTQDATMGSHNKLQSLILPFRESFKYVNRLAMTAHVRIRTVLLVFVITLLLCKKTHYATFGSILIFCVDLVLDPSFMIR